MFTFWHKTASLNLAQEQIDEYWGHNLLSEETRINLFCSNGIQDNHSNGVGKMTFIDGTMNACGYPNILADTMTPSLQKLGISGMFQHDTISDILLILCSLLFYTVCSTALEMYSIRKIYF